MNEDLSLHNQKQPPVLKLAFFCAMWERFGIYVLNFLMVLYAKSEFGLSDATAFLMYGVFTALAYLATATGGYLADNVFGIRRSIVLGLLLEGTGLTLLAIPSRPLFSFCLALIIAGVGLFKTGPTHLMGRSYKDKDPRIDSGFTWYYMGMNLGSFISSILVGIIQKYYGWHIAFLLGGAGIFLSLLAYFYLKGTAVKFDSESGLKKLSFSIWAKMLIGLIVVIITSTYLVSSPSIAEGFIFLGSLVLLGYFIYEIVRSPREEKFKIIACLSLIIMGLTFFVLYQQAYTSMVLFINRVVDRHLFGFEIPTVTFFGLNPIWVVILGPILATIYKKLGKHGRNPDITVKFPTGLLITSFCFFSMVIGGYTANPVTHQVSLWWIVLAYFFYTLGEMLVSALGFSMITQIAPRRMYGIMMGTWFVVGMSLSGILGGFFAGFASVPDNVYDPTTVLNIYSKAFLQIGFGSLVLTALSFAVGPAIKKMANLKQ
jgi:proton-dependent oligopeptide transporter, POT family